MKKLCEVVVAHNSLVIGLLEDGTRILFDTGGLGLGAVIAAGDFHRTFQLAGKPFKTERIFPGWGRDTYTEYENQTRQGDSIDIILGSDFLSQHFPCVVLSMKGICSVAIQELTSKPEEWLEMKIINHPYFPILSTSHGPFFLDSGMAKSWCFDGLVNEPRNLVEGPRAFLYTPKLGTIEACMGNLELALVPLMGEPLRMSSTKSATQLSPQNGLPAGTMNDLSSRGFKGFIGADLFEQFDVAFCFHEKKVFLRQKDVV